MGLHPLGGTTTVRAGDGAVAIHRALRDAGVDWKQAQSLYAGSLEVANPEAVTGLVGMTGLPARAVLSGCATGNSLLTLAARDVQNGEADIAVGVGLDKHPRGPFGADPAVSGLPQWYGDQGMFLTTTISAPRSCATCMTTALPSRRWPRSPRRISPTSRTPHAWRRKAMSAETILASPIVNAPLRQYMYCNPTKVRPRWLSVGRQSQAVHGPRSIFVPRRCAAARGAYELLRTSIELPLVPGTTAEAAAPPTN
ncbi:putative propanoyl-CoA C-acyltransferase [Mycobacterium xenopi 4042]|uniref:Putative propanoyl-CoA C-acyltransferase n=1 Tax=Mycobacterium xenopi 4042 TaxID=1299334 RepID=X8BJR9_MYCXE|nr:putative propanoyl-CoA C-acyltransferase [Mycobacterium xenopi 4042]